MLMITVIDLGNIVQFRKNTIGSDGVTVQYSKNYLFFRRYYPVFEKTVRFVAVTVRETKTQSILPKILSRNRKYYPFCCRYYPVFEKTVRFVAVTVQETKTQSILPQLLSRIRKPPRFTELLSAIRKHYPLLHSYCPLFTNTVQPC
ncbi:hypothetical protein [Siminovitchia terrae]|uniref:hypothetical protein n=1 Tax=Siminovitchia terrae TaxID=1914933 RepID=UPI001BB2F8B1|nr:hypothetical protein [Siminovitchia terrae]